jgi:cobalt-zinc-cadmium efflux system protein
MTGSAHGLSGSAQYERALKMVLALTATYLAVETVGGLLTHSLALLADAAHMLTDVGGLAFGLMAIRIGRRPATPTHTYGFYRAEILAAIVNGITLLGISGYILFEAWQRFRNPQAIASGGMLLVSVVGLGVNIAGASLLARIIHE